MLASSNKWSGEMMGKGGDDGLRTVECLRGRLLAERAGSKAAKAEVDLLSRKLEELEWQLAEERKYRDRVEKRLKYALKKLESLKLFDVSSKLNLSESSVGSSSAYLVGDQKSEYQKTDSRAVDSGQCGSGNKVEEKQEHSGSEVVSSKQDQSGSGGDLSSHSPSELVSHEGSWSPVGTSHSHNREEFHRGDKAKDEELTTTDKTSATSNRQYPVKANQLDSEKQQVEYEEDNSLALVPASMWSSSGSCKPEIKLDVQGVLLTLRHVKEQLQSSMGIRVAVSSPIKLYGQ